MGTQNKPRFYLDRSGQGRIYRQFRDKKAQNVLEFILLVIVVIGVVLAFVVKGGPFAQSLNRSLYIPAAMVQEKNQEIKFDSSP